MSDIVKDSEPLKKALLARWEELCLTGQQIAVDAQKRGLKSITQRSISTYKHHSYAKGALNQYEILALAWLYGVQVRLVVGEPVMEGKRLKYIVPTPFNEEKAIKDFNNMFPFDSIVMALAKKENITVKKKAVKKRK